MQKRLPDHADLAFRDAELCAVLRWIDSPDYEELAAPASVAALAIQCMIDREYCRAGLPLPTGKERVDLLARLSIESQKEAHHVYCAVFKQWEQAGRPCLTGDIIAKAYTYTLACIRKKERTSQNDCA
ncbi:hypothetical protein NYR55_11390 [Sphingomonas sp. BGYR3]|uniref:hypothetical protein n=1 Tax=Sphingomonas sp. BGYR3 TaxID=2975483 RepID=UPI0021A5EE14|nr:hypothetical protein [Sphingomonas sp. BGYR3]MDG5489217.1 hypothetical protein [Sphingomonas sp. BGYR3]